MGELQVEGVVRSDLLRDGLWAMDLAVERHPFDGESRLVRANFLELAGSDEGAVRDYLKGIEATWKREEQFGALAGFSDYLARCGEQAFQARDPEGALAYYQLALDYLLRSWELKFRGNGWAGHGEKVKFLRGRIEFLTGARVEPATLDGIPPPPQR